MMTFAWLLIDVVGRRKLMLWCSAILIASFVLLTIFGGVVMTDGIHVPTLPFAISGVTVLFIATASFGIGWLPQPWLIPTEIYPSAARAKGAAISVVVWGFANFAVTFLSPILFNNFKYWIFAIFAVTNLIAGALTWVSLHLGRHALGADGYTRHTRQKRATELLKKMHSSSLTPKKKTRGESAGSMVESSVVYPGRKKKRTTMRHHRCFNEAPKCSSRRPIDQLLAQAKNRLSVHGGWQLGVGKGMCLI